MNNQNFETILAQLYTDSDFLSEFLKDPQTILKESNLSAEQIRELIDIDKAGLILAHRSFKRKREKYSAHKKPKLSKTEKLSSFFKKVLNRVKKLNFLLP